jgi:hypothetical protein
MDIEYGSCPYRTSHERDSALARISDLERQLSEARAALEHVIVGGDAHSPGTYHTNGHHASCALHDCSCLEDFVRAALKQGDTPDE